MSECQRGRVWDSCATRTCAICEGSTRDQSFFVLIQLLASDGTTYLKDIFITPSDEVTVCSGNKTAPLLRDQVVSICFNIFILILSQCLIELVCVCEYYHDFNYTNVTDYIFFPVSSLTHLLQFHPQLRGRWHVTGSFILPLDESEYETTFPQHGDLVHVNICAIGICSCVMVKIARSGALFYDD